MEYTVGSITLFAYSFIPMDWLPCDGRSLSIATYGLLYSVIGTRYGGDGISNFNLPNLQAAMPNPYIQYFIAYNGIYPQQN